MADGVHGTVAHFRVAPDLIASAAEKARNDGMTLSEFIRAAIRREVKA